jgi:segregation and condensation protein A
MSKDLNAFEPSFPDYSNSNQKEISDKLVLRLDGFEGPIDLLLALARTQKVDLTKISILGLAEQYLDFIEQARLMSMELAADYLVMAAWLAYLKSRILIPVSEDEDEPSGAEMAAALKYQLQRLEAMSKAADKLFSRPLLDRDVFQRGAPEGISVNVRSLYNATLFEILQAYGSTQNRRRPAPLHIEQMELFSMDEALGRLNMFIGKLVDWSVLSSFLPEGLENELVRRSAVAANFAASLELVKSGKAEIRQDHLFGPIFFRSRGENISKKLVKTNALAIEEGSNNDGL